jgi:hypothetical protein
VLALAKKKTRHGGANQTEKSWPPCSPTTRRVPPGSRAACTDAGGAASRNRKEGPRPARAAGSGSGDEPLAARARARAPHRMGSSDPPAPAPRTTGLFGWCPGKAAWPRQRAQASDFGGLGSGSLPGRRAAWQGCIQTSPND